MSLGLQITPGARRRAPPRAAAADAARWREVTKLLAYHLHSLRDLLKLSQSEVAALAGVSQGAISRLEAGRCTDTPLVTYARVVAALSRELGPIRTKLSPGVRTALDAIDSVLAFEGPRASFGLLADPTLQSLIRIYEELPASDRAAYAEMLETMGRWMLARVES